MNAPQLKTFCVFYILKQPNRLSFLYSIHSATATRGHFLFWSSPKNISATGTNDFRRKGCLNERSLCVRRQNLFQLDMFDQFRFNTQNRQIWFSFLIVMIIYLRSILNYLSFLTRFKTEMNSGHVNSNVENYK